MNTVSKTDLVANIADELKMTKVSVKKVIEAFQAEVTKQVVSGNEVQLLGFATFKKVVRPARAGRNPHTGESLQISETPTVKIKTGALLAKAVK